MSLNNLWFCLLFIFLRTLCKPHSFSYRVVMSLEFSQYLEKYLWHHFAPERVDHAYLMSIVLMVIEKWRQGISPWLAFVQHPQGFPQLMHLVMDACTSGFKVQVVTFVTRVCEFLCRMESTA